MHLLQGLYTRLVRSPRSSRARKHHSPRASHVLRRQPQQLSLHCATGPLQGRQGGSDLLLDRFERHHCHRLFPLGAQHSHLHRGLLPTRPTSKQRILQNGQQFVGQ